MRDGERVVHVGAGGVAEPLHLLGVRQADELHRGLEVRRGEGVHLGECEVRVEVVGQRVEDAGGDDLRGLHPFGLAEPCGEAAGRLLALLLGPVHRLAVVGGEHDEADDLAGDALGEQVADGEEVAERLRHLLAFDLQHLVVQPDAGEVAVGVGAGGLGDLVLVVGELEVDAAAVDVEAFAEDLPRHGRAFDVPAGAAPAPRAVPAGEVVGRRASRGRSPSGCA